MYFWNCPVISIVQVSLSLSWQHKSCTSGDVPGIVSKEGREDSTFKGITNTLAQILPWFWLLSASPPALHMEVLAPWWLSETLLSLWNLPGLWNPDPTDPLHTPSICQNLPCYQNYFGPSSIGALKLESLGVLPQPFAVIKSF